MKNNKSGIEKIKKWNKILEKAWLFIAISTLLFSVVIAFMEAWVWEKITVYFLLSGLAWGIYLIRRGLRKRLDKNSILSNK